MYKLFLSGLVIHLLFLCSIFDIYFRSPVINGLSPQKNLSKPPARRLVLFVADGLRAQSFYEGDLKNTNFLKRIILEEATCGISHTRVPTESRPGHVALIAGLYEDPSAVTKGWQDNPVDFDSVFNRSQVTYSWGSPDILPIFVKGDNKNHIHTHSYNSSDEDFSGKQSTILLDNWVFDKVKKFLTNSKKVEEIRETDKVIFFLHLLGLDTAGHVHKPHSSLYNENLLAVDKGISEMYDLFERYFVDGRTSYVFTADHGMTDRGSHGAGDFYETETPFVAWGAGVKKSASLVNHKQKFFTIDHKLIPRLDIEQADVAPFMATLIGVPPPMNNFGRLPYQYLNVSQTYLVEALFNNALQIVAQFKKVSNEFHDGKLSSFLRHFPNEESIWNLENHIRKLLVGDNYDKIVAKCQVLINYGLDGIEFYQTYYQKLFLLSISLAMLGWLMFSLQEINKNAIKGSLHNTKNICKNNTIISMSAISATFVVGFIFLQNIQPHLGIYLLLPIVCLTLAAFRWHLIKSFDYKNNALYIIIFLAGTELLVLSFFHRSTLMIILLIYSMTKTFQLWKNTSKILIAKWIISSIMLSVFPALPVIEKDANDPKLLLAGCIFWIIYTVGHFWTVADKRNISARHHMILVGVFLIIMTINLGFSIKSIDNNEGLHFTNQFISWICLVTAFVIPLLSPLQLRTKLLSLASCFSVTISIMSLSYEPIFFLVFTMNIMTWMDIEFSRKLKNQKLNEIVFTRNIQVRNYVELSDCTRMYIILLYIFIAFFGTGNFASISSFDPNWVRCLVTTFSPFLMTTLIIIKLLMPILFVACILRAIHVIMKISMAKLFLVILLICDVMGMNFLFLVKNKGSWLEIGQSISHFVIMQVTVLVLILLNSLTFSLTSWDFKQISIKLKSQRIMLPINDKKAGKNV